MRSIVSFICLSLFIFSCQNENSEENTQIENQEVMRIVFLGNSITAGYGLTNPLDAYPFLIEQKAKAENKVISVLNAGISGETTGDALIRLPLVLAKPLDVLIIELGINDFLQGYSIEEVEGNLQKMIQQTKAAYPDCRILLMDCPISFFESNQEAVSYTNAFPDFAKKQKVRLIKSHLDKVWTDTDLLMLDRLHPNKQGFELMAEEIWKEMKAILF